MVPFFSGSCRSIFQSVYNIISSCLFANYIFLRKRFKGYKYTQMRLNIFGDRGDAYSYFAECFQRKSAKMSSELSLLDIFNVVPEFLLGVALRLDPASLKNLRFDGI